MTNTRSATRSTHAVVVGVDGTAASVNAVRYARGEAARCGVGVEIVHVVPTYIPMTPGYALPPEDLMEAGRSVLRSVMDQLEPFDAVPVKAFVRKGGIVATLTAQRHAQAVVVGSDRRSVVARLLTGNVSTLVAASAPVPTVSVPETWRPDEPKGVVLVGVKHRQQSDELLAEAFSVAHQRGSRLVVLHAWKMPAGYEDLIANPRAYEDWDSRVGREIEEMLSAWRTQCPDVDVELRTAHDQPAHSLVEASAEADEVVLVRRAHGAPPSVHLGATARSVLMHSHCPVRIVPPGHVRLTPDLTLEAAGTLLK
ncbi:universal stress protein [Nocardioides astragali]|uniref:Universal stress protein n=1 Tax=Nocardioides astragali TaxID=1776736 RepID=A0ABW2N7N1_9ACTN|nr:universal stress protein [Nocardioides astragali]